MLEILERAQSCSLTDMEKEILAFFYSGPPPCNLYEFRRD